MIQVLLCGRLSPFLWRRDIVYMVKKSTFMFCHNLQCFFPIKFSIQQAFDFCRGITSFYLMVLVLELGLAESGTKSYYVEIMNTTWYVLFVYYITNFDFCYYLANSLRRLLLIKKTYYSKLINSLHPARSSLLLSPLSIFSSPFSPPLLNFHPFSVP